MQDFEELQHIYIPWEETAKQVTYFSQRLQYSGYSKHDRHEMISMAEGHINIRQQEQCIQCPQIRIR